MFSNKNIYPWPIYSLFSGIFRNYLMWMHGIGIMWKAQVVIYGLTFCLIVVTSVKNPDKPSEYHCTVARFWKFRPKTKRTFFINENEKSFYTLTKVICWFNRLKLVFGQNFYVFTSNFCRFRRKKCIIVFG